MIPILIKLFPSAASILKFLMVLMIILFVVAATYITYLKSTQHNSKEQEMISLVNDNINESFTPELFYEYLKEINIRFPDIVYAQAVLETDNFDSKIFTQNHNLFGMKLSSRRVTTTHIEKNRHAYYDTWKSSVLDYAFYQSTYLNDIKTHGEYLLYLEKYYSETNGYSKRVNGIIKSDSVLLNKK